MSQTTLNKFFTQKKSNQKHPVKKLVETQEFTEKKDLLKTITRIETVANENTRAVSVERISKKDAFAKNTHSQEVSDLQVSSAKVRASSLGPVSKDDKTKELSAIKKTAKANVSFIKQGALSPRKIKSQSPFKVEKKSFLSPRRLEAIDALVSSEIKSPVVKKLPFKTPEKASPADVKKRLGSTNKLQVLQARLKGLSESPEKPTARKALFVDENSSDKKTLTSPFTSPTLSRKGIALEVEVRKPVIPSSPFKASPRKQALEKAEKVVDKTKDLLQASSNLPLPKSYKDLLEVFKKFDGVVAIKHNRNQAMPVDVIKNDVKIALRRALTDKNLQQIRCVLPKAYLFTWEPKKDSRGRPTEHNELYISANLEESSGKIRDKFEPRDQVERQKLFEHSLLTIVQDHHQDYLKSQAIEGVDNSQIHRWDKNFDVESCPPIDEAPFPEKPYVESPIRNPQEMLERIKGIQNQSVEKALNRVIQASATPTKQENVKLENMTPISKAVDDDIKLDPRLKGLPESVLAKIRAKAKEKRIRDMTMDKTKQKEIELLEDLLHKRFFSSIVNCHNTLRKGKAVPIDNLCARTAQSSGKAKANVLELLKLFMQICPNVLTVKVIMKVEQVLGHYRKEAPDFDSMEKAIQEVLNKKK